MRIDLLAAEVLEKLKEKRLTLATAESCTGGGIGHALTAVPGSSAAYLGGVISYTNAVKAQILGVPETVLEQYGAVSEQTAAAMAKGVQTLLGADIGVSVTGLAGPDSDGSGKPVGLVYIGSRKENPAVSVFQFSGDRETVRNEAIRQALELVLQTLRA